MNIQKGFGMINRICQELHWPKFQYSGVFLVLKNIAVKASRNFSRQKFVRFYDFQAYKKRTKFRLPQ